jgi:hypothetical protein
LKSSCVADCQRATQPPWLTDLGPAMAQPASHTAVVYAVGWQWWQRGAASAGWTLFSFISSLILIDSDTLTLTHPPTHSLAQRLTRPHDSVHLQLHHLPSHSYVDPLPICCRALPIHGFHILPLWWWRWRWLCGGDCGDIVLVVVDGTAGWHWSVSDGAGSG